MLYIGFSVQYGNILLRFSKMFRSLSVGEVENT